MYDYASMEKESNREFISSVAMKMDGEYIEDVIDGYSTLNVSGREVLSYKVNMQEDISGRDGAVLFDKTLPPRYLDIEYQLLSSSSEKLQHKYRQLNQFLDKRLDSVIQFLDEPDITYYGQLVEMDAPEKGKLNVVGTFRLMCSDPYKYESGNIAKGNPLDVYLRSAQAVKPTLIDVLLVNSTDKVIVRNETTARRIILNGEYKSGDNIKIVISENKVLKSGQDITKELDYVESDFHSFLVKNGDRVSVVPSSAELTLTSQSRWK